MNGSERMYATLLENVPVGFFQASTEGNVVFANDAFRRLAGMRAAAINYETMLSRIHPDDRGWLGEYWRRICREGVSGRAVYRIRADEGRIFWAQSQVAPILDGEGQITGFAGTVTDITAERELRQQTERLSRFYATLRQVNAAIARCSNEKDLYDAICRILADEGGFACAVVSCADWNRRKLTYTAGSGVLQNAAHARYKEVDLDDAEFRTPAIMAMLLGVPTTANDIRSDERFPLHYREAVELTGVSSVAAVPIARFGKSVAALSLLSAEPGFFSGDILSLLDEVGRDLSFALENLAREEKRRQAEEMLASSEENLRVTLHSIGDAVLATDGACRVTLLNPVAERLTGWREAEALGRPVAEVFQIVNQETRAIVASPIDTVLRDGAVVGLANHTLLIARDGTERPIADSGAPIRHAADNSIRGVVLVFRDQSEEYRLLRALREGERRFATLVEMLPVGIFESDVNGATIYGNPALFRLSGLGRLQADTREWLALIHPEDRDRVRAVWHEVVTSGKGAGVEYRYLFPDGRISWAQTTVVPKYDERNEFQGYLGAIVDVSTELQNQRRIEQLSKLYETLSQINSAIVHCRSEQELYERVVSIMVETGGMSGASILLADWPRGMAMLAATAYEWQHEIFRVGAEIDFDDLAERGPVIGALIAGVAATSNDIWNDARFPARFHDMYREIELASVSSFLFRRFGETVAALTVTSTEKGFFSDEVCALIEEVGRDVSFALENFARERQRRQAEEALARNEERLRLGLSVTHTGMYEVEYGTNRIALSAAAMQLMNLGDEALEVDIDTFFSMFSEERQVIARQVHAEMLRGERDSYTASSSWPTPDGSVRWVRNHFALSEERSAEGNPLRMVGVLTDITESMMLAERERLAATVFENSGEAIVIIGADRKILMVNKAFCRDTGYEPADVLGCSDDLIRSDLHDAAFFADIANVVSREGIWQGEVLRRGKSGKVCPTLSTYSAVRDARGELTHYVLQSTDISQQKAYEDRISRLAYRDALTDLPNRALLRDRVEQSVASAHRDGGTLALLFLDLDHFKNINDSLGHSVGDHLLQEIARRLSGAVREMDTVGRLGGDEFLVLLPGADAGAAGHVAQKLLQESARTFVSGAHSLTITPSIGIALYPKDGASFDELLKTADTAMYRAKDEGRNAYRFYTEEMNQAVFQRMILESSLRQAIENQEFVLHYQPKFTLLGQTLVGVEALIRWRSPVLGMVSPAQFIPVAEDSGLIEVIGKWVLEESCRQVRIWREQCAPSMCVAVNFSARQFAARNVVELVSAALENAGVPGCALEMEITESLLAQDMKYTLEVLQSLRKLGVRIAVDDFGTGYSSLSYLKRFPIDRLKLDQSFVRELVSDADDRAIATTVITLGHALGMCVIAEGVETAEQLAILKELGCDEVQGYLVGRPVTAEAMTDALRN